MSANNATRARIDKLRNRLQQLERQSRAGEDVSLLLELLKREIQDEKKKPGTSRNKDLLPDLLRQIDALLPHATGEVNTSALPSVRNRIGAFGPRIFPGAPGAAPRANLTRRRAMPAAGAAAPPLVAAPVAEEATNNGPPNLHIWNEARGIYVDEAGNPVNALPAGENAVAGAPEPNVAGAAAPAGNARLNEMRARLDALRGGPVGPARPLRNVLLEGAAERPVRGPDPAIATRLAALRSAGAPPPPPPGDGAPGGGAPLPGSPAAYVGAPAPLPEPANPTGIAPYVKKTQVPLQYDMETCELVATADRKGIAQGFLEARGKSLNLLSQSVRALATQEQGLVEAKTSKALYSGQAKLGQARLQAIQKQLAKKRAEQTRALPGAHATRVAAEVADLEQQEAVAQQMLEQEKARAEGAKRSISALSPRTGTGVKPSRWPWGPRRGGTRRLRSTRRRRTTRRTRN